MDFLTNLKPEIIIQGGAVVIALALVGLVGVMAKNYFDMAKRYYNHTGDVIDRNTDAWKKNANAQTKHAVAIQRLTDVIDKKIK